MRRFVSDGIYTPSSWLGIVAESWTLTLMALRVLKDVIDVDVRVI